MNKKQPEEVIIAEEQTPVPVEVVKEEQPTPVKTKGGGLSLPPTTTEQQDIVTAGQRVINVIWESTQATIAVLITLAIIYTSVVKIDSQVLTSAFFLIIGFYFARTNHQNIGGVGSKASSFQDYRGR